MSEKHRYNFLIFACAFLWIMMTGSKNVYTAELVEIMQVFNVSKAETSLAMTYYFITYSTTQVIFFFIMDHINIKWYMTISIFLSGIVTVFVAIVTGMWQLWWLLSLNGILQAGVWGMCLAVLNKYLPTHMHPKANTAMNVGMAVAGIISYGSSSLFVSIGRWYLPFIILGIILSLSAIIFFVAVRLCENIKRPCDQTQTDTDTKTEKETLPFTLETKNKKALFYVVTFVFSLFIHSVYYATLNWLPNLITENYGLKNSISILISVLAPLATTLGPILAINHCEKSGNFIKVGLTYLIIATVFAFLRIFLFDVNLILALIIIIIFLILAQALITIIFSVISYKMSPFINAGAHAGLMNAAGGYAAGLSPTIIGAIIDATSWQFSCTLICIITATITVSVIVVTLLINKKKRA
ncbi:MAG: MFS transporter [Clostridia bacterium]|nr:MFS transporter [Clostridia bacterium]